MSFAFGDGRLPARFWAKVAPFSGPGGCWHWMAYVDSRGYARFYLDGVSRTGHSVAYTRLIGPVPHGLELDHLCRLRSCVHPLHLEAVTRAVNVARGLSPLMGPMRGLRQLAKTHCPSGHEYAGYNLIRKCPGDGRERRACRACKNADAQRRRMVLQQGEQL